MCAYVDADAGRARAGEVLMVSIGTGSQTRPIPYEKVKDWGRLQWTRPILDVVFFPVTAATDYQLRQVLGTHRGGRMGPSAESPLSPSRRGLAMRLGSGPIFVFERITSWRGGGSFM